MQDVRGRYTQQFRVRYRGERRITRKDEDVAEGTVCVDRIRIEYDSDLREDGTQGSGLSPRVFKRVAVKEVHHDDPFSGGTLSDASEKLSAGDALMYDGGVPEIHNRELRVTPISRDGGAHGRGLRSTRSRLRGSAGKGGVRDLASVAEDDAHVTPLRQRERRKHLGVQLRFELNHELGRARAGRLDVSSERERSGPKMHGEEVRSGWSRGIDRPGDMASVRVGEFGGVSERDD